MIDYVCEINSPSAIEAIRKLRPNFYSKGKEYKNLNKDITNKIKSEISELKKQNGKIVYTDDVTFSSSKILNDLEVSLSPQQLKEVRNIKKNEDFETLLKKFEELKKLKRFW